MYRMKLALIMNSGENSYHARFISGLKISLFSFALQI